MKEKRLTHFDTNGNAVMVDVSEKDVTSREAIARGFIHVNEDVMQAILTGTSKKGDVLGVARVAGIMAAKRTSDSIPMCHPLLIQKASIDFVVHEKELCIEATCFVKVGSQTGVEMEALHGVTIALLTIYDMCKALDREMELKDIHLVKKSGGKSGLFINSKETGGSEHD